MEVDQRVAETLSYLQEKMTIPAGEDAYPHAPLKAFGPAVPPPLLPPPFPPRTGPQCECGLAGAGVSQVLKKTPRWAQG